MHIHNVYFWLQDGLDSQVLDAFEQGLRSLTEAPEVRGGHFGKPASTRRDVVDSSYSHGLVLVFDDLAAHNAYQEGSAHLKFVADHGSRWTKVVVYDIQPE
jgi:hypothetical protein